MSARVEQSIEVAVDLERAWELVSTSAGISSWFVTAQVDPGPAGSVTLRFGPGAEGTMPIQRWEPPRRIRFGAAKGEPGRAHAFELAPTPGGGAMVRVIDDGLGEADAKGARQAWAGYLGLAGHYDRYESQPSGATTIRQFAQVPQQPKCSEWRELLVGDLLDVEESEEVRQIIGVCCFCVR